MDRYLTKEELDRVREAGFNIYGLRYPLEHLQEIVPTELTMENIAKYTDAITFAKVGSNDVEFFDKQLVPIPENSEVKVNITGLGNLAYISLHIEDEEIKKRAGLLYQQILDNYHPSQQTSSD